MAVKRSVAVPVTKSVEFVRLGKILAIGRPVEEKRIPLGLDCVALDASPGIQGPWGGRACLSPDAAGDEMRPALFWVHGDTHPVAVEIRDDMPSGLVTGDWLWVEA